MPLRQPELEPKDALFGMLQRGLGRGHLEAIDRPRDEARTELLRFVLSESRIACDTQLDERDRYVGEIAMAIGLEADPLVDRLRVNLAADPDSDGLELPVLMQMARRGDETARRAVVEALRVIPHWGNLLSELIQWGVDLDGVAVALAERDEDDEQLADELRAFAYSGPEERGVIASIPRIGDLLPPAATLDKSGGRKRERSKHFDRLVRMSTAELLDRVEPNRDGIVTIRQAIASADHPFDAAVALDAARDGSPLLRAAAMVGLGAHQVDELLDIAPRLVTTGRADEAPHPERHVQFGAYYSLQRLRTDRALAKAREWLGSKSALTQAALPVIAARSPMPEFIAAFEDVEVDDIYLACDLVEGLIDRAESGAEHLVRSIYEEAAYDRLRYLCVRYLLAHDKRFRSVDGVDALWDASDLWVRPTAIKGLDLTLSEPRLRELAADAASDVSEEATTRLTAS